ncbi:unnamed protein product, partial [marine sediment metagenome]
LWRILGNEDDVCDAYQETFLKLAHSESGRKPLKVKAYLFRTASNVAISILRRQKTFNKVCNSLAYNVPARQQMDPTGDLDIKYLQESLRLFIARLPDHLRNAVVLRDLGELPYQQVGKIIRVSAGTARVYRCQAVKLLAAWMAEGKRK